MFDAGLFQKIHDCCKSCSESSIVAGLVQESFVVSCRSYSTKQGSFLKVLFRKALIFAVGLVQQNYVICYKAVFSKAF